jgi:hypothetical protein
MLGRAPYIAETDVSEEDQQAYARVFAAISKGGRPQGLLLQDIITAPERHGVKNAIRQELLKVVANTLGKAGYIGKPEDFRMQEKLFKLLQKQNQEGGMF